tara:strand:- start:73 stop:2964 length:2892 start_codon:yes stop_codon:yes gene_type:complete
MANNDNSLKNKVSTHIQNQLPEFIQSDHPVFNQFIKLYYQFLESSEITFSEVNNYLVQETTSVNFVLDESSDNIVLEDSEAKFSIGETITGLTSGATAKVLVDDVDNNKRLFVTSQTRFIIGETVNGSSSNSSGTIESYRPNPVSSIQQLLNYTNVDATLYTFLDRFRDSFLEGITDNIDAGVDKRKLTKNIRDLYIAKGTKKGHELFFRLLLNEDPRISFPTDNMLRVSDGRWTTRNIMRVNLVTGVPSELIGVTVTGQTSAATAIVVSSITFREAETDIIELELDAETINGTFVQGETISGISTVTDQDVTFTPYSINIDTSIINEGAYYTAGQTVNISSGGSNSAIAKVQTVKVGQVDEIIIDDAGTGYAVGDNLVLDNSGTDGSGAQAQVSVVGGGIAPESGSLTAYEMSATDHITLEETSQSFYQDSYEGTKIVLETGTFANLSVATQAGEITDVRMISKGNGYAKLPTVTSITSTSGASAKLLTGSTSGVGGVGSFEFTNQGFNYNSAPTLTAFRHAVLKDITGTFVTGSSLTSHSGTVTAFDNPRQLLSMNTTANLVVGNTVSTGSASGTIANINIATGTATVGTIGKTSGEFFGADGKISEDVMKVQDSYYYQDYSYVVRVGQSINEWRDAIKSTVHPAGWQVFGEVEVVGKATARMTAQTVDSFTPELASLFRTLFSAVFGRRLGTVDDGTSLRSTPKVGVESHTDLPNTTRDTTLTRINNVIVGSARTPSAHGPTLDLLPKYAFAISPRDTANNIPNYPTMNKTKVFDRLNDEYFTIGQFANIRIDQVDDGTGAIPLAAFDTRINVPPPGQIDIDRGARINAFDNNYITFDNTFQTFDETVLTTLMSDTGIKFDSSTIKFDGSGGDVVPRDVVGKYKVDFSDTNVSFDSGINKFDTQNTVSSGSSIPRFDDAYVTFDRNNLKFDNTSIPERFSSNVFKFDSSTKTFDIGDLPT